MGKQERTRLRRYRRLFTLTAALAFALITAACAADEEPPEDVAQPGEVEEAAEEDSPSAEDEFVEGGELRVIHPSEPSSLNPATEVVRPGMRVFRNVMETLVLNDDDFTVTQDGLVTNWERIDDLTWHITLREGVEFTNGEPWNAEAAVFSIITTRDEGDLGRFYATMEDATSIDEHTVEITTTVPTGAVPALLSALFALPPEYYQEVGGDEFGQAPIGTGPYVFEEWVSGQRVTLVRNEDYWGENAYLDRLVFEWASEASTRVALIETGEAHIATDIPPQLTAQLEDAGVTVDRSEGLRQIFLAFNLDTPPFDDVRLRTAVSHAIDRDAIVEQIFGGEAVPNPNVNSRFFDSAGGHGDAYLEYDPDEARRILDEIGDVEPVTLYNPIGRYQNDTEVAEAVAGMLEEVGLEVVREPLEPGTFFETLFGGGAEHMHVTGIAPFYPHEDLTMRSRFVSTALSLYCNIGDEELDEWIDDAFALDGEERARAYNEIEAYVLFEKVCWVPLHDQLDIYGVSPAVDGFVSRPDQYVDFHRLRLRE